MGSKNTFLEQSGLSSAWHLATTPLEAATTELEWAMLRWGQAFERYHCEMMNRLDQSGLSTQEVMILHAIRMQDRPKSAAMIAGLLNRDDIQNIQYSLRKLIAQKCVKKVRDGVGKGFNLAVTDRGRRLSDDVAALRRRLLIEQLAGVENNTPRLMEAARVVSLMTAMCNEAGRTSLPGELYPS